MMNVIYLQLYRMKELIFLIRRSLAFEVEGCCRELMHRQLR